MSLHRKRKIRRWSVRIVLILLLLPFAILITVRYTGWLDMRKTDEEIKSILEPKGVSILMDTLNIRKRDIEYLKTSKGEKKENALILVHGSPGSMDAYLDYMSDTSMLAKVDLIVYDRPGYGNSGFGKSVTTLSGQSDILLGLMDSLAYKKYWLAGHSYGGPVIMQAAIRRPGKIAGICLIAASISPELEPKSVSWRKWIDLPLVRELFPVSMRVSNEELMPLRQDLLMLEDDWDRLGMPVSIIHGSKDVLVPFENVNYAKEKLTKADTVFVKVFEGENHFILWTKEKEIVEELNKLIRYKH